MTTILSIFFIILLPFELFSNSHFRLELTEETNYNDSKYFYNNELSEYSYLLQYDWANDSETILTWKGEKRNKINALNLFESKVLSSIQIPDGMLLLIKSDIDLKIAICDDTPIIISEIELPIEVNAFDNCYFENFSNNYLLNVSGNLFEIITIDDIISYKLIDKNIIETQSNQAFDNQIFYLKRENETGYICRNDLDSLIKETNIVEIFDNNKIFHYQNFLLVLSNQDGIDESFVQVFNAENLTIINNFWIEASTELIDVNILNNKIVFAYLSKENSMQKAKSFELDKNFKKENTFEIEIYSSVIEPLKLKFDSKDFVIIFKNAIITIDLKTNSVLQFGHFPIYKLNRSLDIKFIANKLFVYGENSTAVYLKKENKYWLFYKYYDLLLQYIFPIILIIIIIILIQFYRHNRRIYRELINLESAGIILELDSSGRLLRGNSKAYDFIKFTRGVPHKKLFSYYMNFPEAHEIVRFIDKSLLIKDNITDKITVEIEGNIKEWLCTMIALRNVAGILRGYVFTAIDITEQLEKKRLTNWAQLAHDMQTNLSTIKLNAEHLDSEENTNNSSRRKKILHQVNILMQRVRDIVTVGRSDKIEISEANSGDICVSARNEFDESIFPDVSFEVSINDFIFKCDKQKLIRAVRNAIENAIKALPEKKGNISINCYKDKNFAYFKIKDNGKGMDEMTKDKMMQPYFTTAENRGGFGIGTMIMQHVAELHGGKIEVVSTIGKGTEIIFIIPLKIQ